MCASEYHFLSYLAIGSRYGLGTIGIQVCLILWSDSISLIRGAEHGDTKWEGSFRLGTPWGQEPCVYFLQLYSQ